MKRTVIGIAGGSGSGKTTLAHALKARVGARAEIVYQDSYYIDQSRRFDEDGGAVNFDHPDSLEFSLLAEHLRRLKNGSAVEIPRYDFATHRRLPDSVLFRAPEIVIVDGTLLLSQPVVCDELDIKVFVHTDEALRFERRLERDVRERGRTPDGVRKQFTQQVKPMHDLYIEGSRDQAHIVFSGDFDVVAIAKRLVDRIDTFERPGP